MTRIELLVKIEDVPESTRLALIAMLEYLEKLISDYSGETLEQFQAHVRIDNNAN